MLRRRNRINLAIGFWELSPERGNEFAQPVCGSTIVGARCMSPCSHGYAQTLKFDTSLSGNHFEPGLSLDCGRQIAFQSA